MRISAPNKLGVRIYCVFAIRKLTNAETQPPETAVKMQTGERQIARLPRRRPDFREKSHKMIPKLTTVKTQLSKTTVKMKTGERQTARLQCVCALVPASPKN